MPEARRPERRTWPSSMTQWLRIRRVKASVAAQASEDSPANAQKNFPALPRGPTSLLERAHSRLAGVPFSSRSSIIETGSGHEPLKQGLVKRQGTAAKWKSPPNPKIIHHASERRLIHMPALLASTMPTTWSWGCLWIECKRSRPGYRQV